MTLNKFLAQFPDNAVSWSQAPDKIRDMARTAKEIYNETDLDLLEEEYETKGQPALDFRSMKTPSQWNTEGKKYILIVLAKMSPLAKQQFYSRFETWFK